MKALKLIIPAMLLLFAACVYDYEEPTEIPDFDEMDPISLSEDVVPIFEANCVVAGCHGEGGVPPVLTAEQAYNDLHDFEQVDVDNPQDSILYQRMTDSARPMPPAGVLPQDDLNTVLGWIAQGAQDN